MTLTSRDLLGLGAAPDFGSVLTQAAAPAQVGVAIVLHMITCCAMRDARADSGPASRP